MATGTGGGEDQVVRVIARVSSGPGFEPGVAQADANADIGSPGSRTVDDTFLTSEEVTIEIPSGLGG